jgi:hypothetical protein
MVIDKFFIYYKKPSQYLYWGENYMDLYAVPTTEKGKRFTKIKTYEKIPLMDASADDFLAVARDLPTVDTGIFLNSGNFIFNIFDFEKVPFQENLKRDLVEWRVKKVFPENIGDYEHHFYHLSRTRILSVLFKKSIKEKIEELFKDNGIPLIHMGNSTVEIINRMAKLKKNAPDFFVEIDKNLALVVFQEMGLPYYIRKFRIGKPEDLVAETIKTITFVKNSYAKVPVTYSITVDRTHSDMDFNMVRDELAKQELQLGDINDREQYFFPGKKR